MTKSKTTTPTSGTTSGQLEVPSACPWRPDLAAQIVDDGKVAYAYVTVYGKVVGEVWLYNHGAAEAETDPKAKPPLRNPAPYASPKVEVPAERAEDFAFEWAIVSTGPEVRINLRGKPLARLRPYEKPGRCANAVRNGPVARVLEGEREAQPAAGGDADAD